MCRGLRLPPLVAALTILGLGALSGCGGKDESEKPKAVPKAVPEAVPLDVAAVEDTLGSALKNEEVPLELKVECPDDVEVGQGVQFECKRVLRDGKGAPVSVKEAPVFVTLEDDEGKELSFKSKIKFGGAAAKQQGALKGATSTGTATVGGKAKVKTEFDYAK